MLKRMRDKFTPEKLQAQMAARTAPFRTLRPVRNASEKSVLRYWERLIGPASTADRDLIADPASLASAEDYSGNIENFIENIQYPSQLFSAQFMQKLNVSRTISAQINLFPHNFRTSHFSTQFPHKPLFSAQFPHKP